MIYCIYTMAAFRYSVSVLKIYSIRNVHCRFSVLTMNIEIQSCVPIPDPSAAAALEWERNRHEIKREGEHPDGKSEPSLCSCLKTLKICNSGHWIDIIFLMKIEKEGNRHECCHTSNQCSELQIFFCIGLEQSRLAKVMPNLLRFFLMILRTYTCL